MNLQIIHKHSSNRRSVAAPGATALSEELGIKLDNVTLNMLGRAKKVMIEKENTTIVSGAGKNADIESRIAQIKGQDRGDHLRL